jgi:hypothetical protein
MRVQNNVLLQLPWFEFDSNHSVATILSWTRHKRMIAGIFILLIQLINLQQTLQIAKVLCGK